MKFRSTLDQLKTGVPQFSGRGPNRTGLMSGVCVAMLAVPLALAQQAAPAPAGEPVPARPAQVVLPGFPGVFQAAPARSGSADSSIAFPALAAEPGNPPANAGAQAQQSASSPAGSEIPKPVFLAPPAASPAGHAGEKTEPALGPGIAGGVRSCVEGDDSPAGTIASGYRKNIVRSMFGPVCRWELTK